MTARREPKGRSNGRTMMRFAAAAGLVTLLVACRHARAAEVGAAPDDEPSIEDMLAEIESQKRTAASPGAQPVESRPEPPRPSAPRPPTPRRASKPVKLSKSVEKEIKRLEKRARQCRKLAARRKDTWEMVQLYNRLEQYKTSAKLLSPMLRGRPPARGGDAAGARAAEKDGDSSAPDELRRSAASLAAGRQRGSATTAKNSAARAAELQYHFCCEDENTLTRVRSDGVRA